MIHTNRTLWLVLVGLVMMASPLSAQLPKLVHYQGKLAEASGEANLKFNLYDRPIAQEPVWSEVHNNVPLDNGEFSVALGSREPLRLSFYEYYLEVENLDTGETLPRTVIVGSGYNFRLNFLFAAYTIVWLAIFFYLVNLTRRQKRLLRELSAFSQS